MRIVFMGTPAFGVPTLKMLHDQGHTLMVVSQPNKPVGRKKTLAPTPIASCALALGLTLQQPIKIGDLYETLKAFEPELLITAAYGQYVPTNILALPSIDAINLHASLLPRHRGGAPIQRAIMHGDEETGISVMRMRKQLDAGEVFHQVRLPIQKNETAESLFEKLAPLAAQALLEAWFMIVDGHEPTPQDDRYATLSPNLSKEEEVLNFKQSAQTVDGHIRAFYPNPATYTFFEGKRLKVYQARPLNTPYDAAPGTIVELTEEGIIVACLKGSIELLEVQLEGKKRLTASAFVQGYQAETLLNVVLGPSS